MTIEGGLFQEVERLQEQVSEQQMSINRLEGIVEALADLLGRAVEELESG